MTGKVARLRIEPRVITAVSGDEVQFSCNIVASNMTAPLLYLLLNGTIIATSQYTGTYYYSCSSCLLCSVF